MNVIVFYASFLRKTQFYAVVLIRLHGTVYTV